MSTQGFLKAMPLKESEKKIVGIPLYPNFDSLDVLGPFQTFIMTSGRLTPRLLALSKDPVRSYEGVEIKPHDTFDKTESLDVLFVPGGLLLEDLLGTEPPDKNSLLAFLRRIGAPGKKDGPMLITSVCTGALFLAAAGLLQGFRATTHWNYKSVLAIVALLLGDEAARQGQLTMQYAPTPPFNDGDPSVADPTVLFQVTNSMRKGVAKTTAGFRSYIDKWGGEIISKP